MRQDVTRDPRDGGAAPQGFRESGQRVGPTLARIVQEEDRGRRRGGRSVRRFRFVAGALDVLDEFDDLGAHLVGIEAADLGLGAVGIGVGRQALRRSEHERTHVRPTTIRMGGSKRTLDVRGAGPGPRLTVQRAAGLPPHGGHDLASNVIAVGSLHGRQGVDRLGTSGRNARRPEWPVS